MRLLIASRYHPGEKHPTESILSINREREGAVQRVSRVFRGMHFDRGTQIKRLMLADIEEIVVKEMSGLCASCIHFDECVYRKNSTKVIIQCEVFESAQTNGVKTRPEDTPLRGLCLNCSRNQVCHLPKEPTGVWHCEEYE